MSKEQEKDCENPECSEEITDVDKSGITSQVEEKVDENSECGQEKMDVDKSGIPSQVEEKVCKNPECGQEKTDVDKSGFVDEAQENDCENPESREEKTESEKPSPTILVAGVLKDYEEAVEALVSNRRRGGGIVADYQYDDEHELAWITFEDPNVAQNLLKSGVLKILGHEMKVLSPPDRRTLFIYNVPDELHELVEILLESRKKGGGPISKYDFDDSSGTVTVSFEDEEVAQGLWDKKFIEIRDKKLFFSKIPPGAMLPPHVEADGANETKDCDDLKGDITSKTDDDNEMGDDCIGSSVDRENEAEQEEEEKEDGENDEAGGCDEGNLLSRTIYLKDVPHEMLDFLEVVLGEKRSGGGSIEELTQDDCDVRVTFDDPSVAKKLLSSGKFFFGTKEFAVVPPPERFPRTFSEAFEEEKETEQLPSARVLVRGIPRSIEEEVLLMMLEREDAGGGTVVDIKLHVASGEATIQFEDYQVAQNLLSAGVFKYKKTTLEILPVPEEKAESSDAVVEIRNIPKSMDTNKLYLFFENKRRSGGGDIADLNYDEARCTAVVTFSDPDVAKSLIEKKSVKYTDGTLMEICCPTSSLSSPLPSCEGDSPCDIAGKVWVSEIPAGTKRQTLMMFLENQRRSGGGEMIESEFNYDEEAGTADVTFKDPSVAEAMIGKGQLVFSNSHLKVQKPPARLRASASTSARKETAGLQQYESCTVELRGCIKDFSRDSLYLWFENKGRSGGGDVEDIQILSDDSAVIIFKNAEDAARVAAKGEHSLPKGKLSACLLDTWPSVGGPRAIRVKGFKSGASKDTIEMYFESERRSGGGECEEFLYDENQQTAIITFHDPKIAQRVLERKQSLEGSDLSIEILKPGRPPPLLRPSEVDPNKLLFTGLDLGKTDTKKLREFAARAGNARVQRITFSSKPGMALVQFSEKPDYNNAKSIICSRPYQGKMISLEQIPITKCIQVHSIDKLSQESLELYFESKKSGGGPLRTVKFVEGSYSIIEFSHREDLERVLSTKHNFSQQNLDVQLYSACLGVFPPGFDGSSPVPPIPPDFKVDCQKEILKFFLSPHVKKHIEHCMSKKKCYLTWPRSDKTLIKLNCTIKPNDPSAFQLTQRWEHDCRQFLQAEMDKVKFDEIGILAEIWKSFQEGVTNKINPKIVQLVFYEFDDQRHVLFYSGYADEAREFAKMANDIKSRLEEELDRLKTEIKEPVPMKPHAMYLCKVLPVLSQFADGIKVEETNSGFMLTGQPQPLRAARLKLLEFSNGLVEKSINFKPASDAFEKVLKKDSVKKHINECFKSHKIIATYEVKRGDISLYGTNRDQLVKAEKLLLLEIVEKSIELDEAMKDLLQKQEWMTYKPMLLKDFSFLEISESKSAIVYVSRENEMQAVSERLREFFSGNALYELFIELPAAKMDVLTRHCSHLVGNLKENMKPAELKVCILPVSEKSGFSIRAKQPALKPAELKVRDLVAKIQSKDYRVEKPGAVKSLKSEKGQIILQGISAKHKVVVGSAEEEEGSGQKKNYSDPVLYATAQLKRSGKVVKLVLGDITKNKTDVIVNAANSRLDHFGGVARAIAKAGGSKLNEECERHVKSHGEVMTGRIFVSAAGGSLPHKSVIHAVGPIWKDGSRGEERELASAVTAALKEADKRAYKSVSLPFLSCGIYKFPKKKGASVIVKEVRNFLETSNSVTQVDIVNGDRTSLDIFVNVLNDLSSDFNLIPALMTSFPVNTSARPKTASAKPRPRHRSNPSNRMKATGAASIQTPEGLSLALVRGSIATAKVDALFNSVERNMDLSRTAVSKSVLMAAGSGLLDECRNSFPKGVAYGNVVKTGAHRISCKAIYHGACAKWDNGAGDSERTIRKLVSGTLELAVKDGMTSLAFPAVGTGIKLKTPSRFVADTMIDEVIRFSAKMQKTSLKEVQFVIYEKDQDALNAFGAALQAVSSNAQSTSDDGNSDDNSDNARYNTASSGDERDADSDDNEGEEEGDDDEEQEHGEQEDSDRDGDDDNDDAEGARVDSDDDGESSDGPHQERGARRGARGGGQHRGGYRKHGGRHSSHGNTSSNASVKVLDGKIGDIQFLVNREDITKASVDAIVNGTNDKFNLKYGKLSRAILHAAGNRIFEECSQNRTQDGWSVSSGGHMSCKKIFHITARDAKGWKAAIRKVLEAADDMRLSSIAIPPVGVGRGSLTVREFAEAIVGAVDDFSKNEPGHLKSVCVSIIDHKMLEEFISEVEKIMKLLGKPVQKFLSKLSNALKSFFDLDDEEDPVPARRQKRRPKEKKVVKVDRTKLSKLILRIYGMDWNAIDSAIADIKQHCDEIKQEIELKSAEVKDAISKLTPNQESKLKFLEQKCGVKIHINKQHGHESIVLSSDGGNLTEAMTEIYGILIGSVVRERNSKELELFSKQAIWQYQEGGTWKKYGTYATGTIEKAHHKREKEVEYTDSKGVKHKINFKDNTDERSSGGKVAVTRNVPGSINLPSRWKHMKPEENCLVVKLDPTSEEYKKVEANLKKSDGGRANSIIQIDRIQNQSLYRQFMNRKMDMDRTDNLHGQKQGQENERRLWHGTSGTNVDNINYRNFNRSYCGQHGVAIGNGVYFATGAAYSINGYCQPDASGHKHIYQARVLTGKFCQGKGGLKEAPLLQGSAGVTYDSVVDNTSNPGMFVVFLDYQTYPEYHITFT